MQQESINNFKLLADIGESKAIKALNKLIEIGRIKSYVIIDDDEYSRFDALVVSSTLDKEGNNLRHLVEFKDRKLKSDAYPDYILEVHKYKALRKLKIEMEYDGCLYLNTFKDDTVLIWNMAIAHKSMLRTVYAGKYTAVNSNKQNKQVIMLPYSKAYKIKLDEQDS